MSDRFRRLTDLFAKGRVLELPQRPDGGASGYLWIQVINSYERDECVSDAQVARSRLILALKEDGEERLKVEARVEERGRDVMARELADARATAKTAEFADAMRADPEWKERLEIVIRQAPEDAAAPATPEETSYLAKVNAEVLEELARREDLEREYLIRSFGRMDDEEFINEWVTEWIERRGNNRAAAEYKLTEIWYATRWCDATPREDGDLDHARCDGHRHRVFGSKNEARSADDALITLIRDTLDALNIGGRTQRLGQSAEFLRIVANAKRGGGIDAIYGGDPGDAPWYLTVAISHALTVLSYFELPDEDQPPERIWLDDEAVLAHFKANHERRASGGGELIPEADMEQNELTEMFRR